MTIVSVGCLAKDSSQTWYVEPDGGVHWVVLEQNVRSDAGDALERDREEQRYRNAALRHEHAAAEEFATLGATEVSSRVLRTRVPFTVMTEGRFASLEQLGHRLIDATTRSGSSRTTHVGVEVEWTFEAGLSSQVGPGLDALVGSLDRLTVVLAEGRFVAAANFTLSPDGRAATIALGESGGDATTPVVLGLRWTTKQ
jgi:hypothetical protein